MSLHFRCRTRWIICNAVGMLLYLYLASTLWVRPGEDGLPGGPGDAFYWLLYLVPILLTFLLGNLAALTVIAFRRSGRHRVVAVAVWCVIASLWVGIAAVDHQRSVHYIDAQYA